MQIGESEKKYLKVNLKIFFSSNYGTLFGGRMINLKQYDLLQVEQLGIGTATIHPSHHHTFFEGFYMSQ